MKIIQLTFSLSSGGAEKFVADLSNQLADLGHDVTLCMLLRDEGGGKMSFNKQFLQPKVKFHSMGFNKGFQLNKFNSVEKYIKSEHPDVVHCHLNVVPYIYKLSFVNKKITFIHTLHNLAPYTVKRGLQVHLNHFFYNRQYIHPVCISRLCQESYETFYKLHNAPFINNGRSIASVSPCYKDVINEVNAYKLNQKTPVFIHVARFAKQKNQQLLVDSFNHLYEENIDFILLIIGEGYNSEEGKKLQQSACSKIHFLGLKNNVNDYLRCSDAFCLTSSYEGLPLTLLEALSCGVVPICTPVGGIPDVVKNGMYGYLSSVPNVESYCEAVKRFLECPISRQTLIDYFNANYSMEICAKKYEDLYYSYKNDCVI